MLNDKIKEEHLGIKQLHLNRKGNSVFAKYLLNFTEGNWFLSPLRDTYKENENVSNAWIATVSGAKKTLKNICISNINTVDSRYNEPRREMKNSSLYREFVKSKIEKNREFLLKY